MLGGFLVAAWAFYFVFGQPVGKQQAAVVARPAAVQTVAAVPSQARMEVYITGAVHKPGLYRLPLDSRVAAAIAAAGGALPSADVNGINLAAVVEDGTQIVVPAQGAEGPSLQGVGQAPAGHKIQIQTQGDQSGTRGGRANKLQPGERIGINKASVAQFEELPGIGTKRAHTLYAYRTAHGLFSSLAQLGDVPGIGSKELARILPYVTL